MTIDDGKRIGQVAYEIVQELSRRDYVPTSQSQVIVKLAGDNDRSPYQAGMLSLIRQGIALVGPDWKVRLRRRPQTTAT